MEVGSGVGFRMPARRMYCTRVLRPASESPPGRNPRAAMRPGAVYGDLAGQRFGQGVLRLVWLWSARQARRATGRRGGSRRGDVRVIEAVRSGLADSGRQRCNAGTEV